MAASHYHDILSTVLATGLALMAIGVVCLWIARREQKKREAWLRRWSILEFRSRNRAA